MKECIPLMDADGHVLEPAHLFATGDGRHLPCLPATTPMLLNGRMGEIQDLVESAFAPSEYLRVMDREGIDGAIVYPSLGLYAPFQPSVEPSESADMCSRYNEWIASFCAEDPSRLAGAALVPLVDPSKAAKEVVRAASLDLVAVVIRPNFLYGRNPGDKAYDQLYEAIVEHGLAASLHEGLGLKSVTIGSDRFTGFAPRHACSHPMEMMSAFASLVFDGTLDRHELLRVGLLESGTAWLPYWLRRLDDHVRLLESTECKSLKCTPTEYFARQCFVTTEPDDPFAPWSSAVLGADRLMFASDFPHPEAAFPNAVDDFLQTWRTAGVHSTTIESVAWSTARTFYALEERFTGRAAAVEPVVEAGASIEVRVSEPVDLRDLTGLELGLRYPFASDEWIEVASVITEHLTRDTDVDAGRLIVNMTLIAEDGSAVPLSMARQGCYLRFLRGHTADATTAVEMPIEVARAAFLDGDEEAGMAAFTEGLIRVDGDYTQLLALQQVTTLPQVREWRECLKTFTE